MRLSSTLSSGVLKTASEENFTMNLDMLFYSMIILTVKKFSLVSR